VALSGGGNRAALFAVGALMALVDMRTPVTPKPVVVSIASVSGGSITNGLLARGGNEHKDFEEMSADDLKATLSLRLSRGSGLMT